jgi:hypothetical protein
MGAALKLFADLGITYSAPDQQTSRRPMATNCLGVVERMIRKFGLPHSTITLRTIVESKGNECALIADIVDAVSDLILANPRWPARGLEFIEAFDAIDLLEIRKAAKATGVQPLRAGIMGLVGIQLTQVLGPSRPPKPKPVKVKREPAPPYAEARVAGIEANVELGRKLAALRAQAKSNRAFGRAVRAQFDIEAMHAVECARVARAYGDRPDIYRRLSWNALVLLSSPTLPSPARQRLEARILAGEPVVATDIVRARQAHAAQGKKDGTVLFQKPGQPVRACHRGALRRAA